MDSIQAEYDALMVAVDADLEADDPKSALARLEAFIQKHARPEDEWLGVLTLIAALGA